jgi:predicted NACHT family NTPase
MADRALQASQEGLNLAQRALTNNRLTQKALAERLQVTRQPIGKFFRGDRVDRNLFVEICRTLNLDWEEVVKQPDEPDAKAVQDAAIDIDALVQEVREKIKPFIQDRCGYMRVLDMTEPIGLDDIYTKVNIVKKITGLQHKPITELLQEYKPENFERFGLTKITEERVPALEAVNKYTKLMMLGKPGAGKTTFLKYVSLQCSKGEFHAELVPVFVALKDFSEALNKPNLVEYINHQFSRYKVTATQVTYLLNQSRVLLLLDGIDEVRDEDNSRVLKEIRNLSDFFQGNRFIMTCRIAAQEYTFEKFTEVEIADFDKEQISTFAASWFKGKSLKSETFIKQLENNSRIKELAGNPLLLTLLSLRFEGSMGFPANRSELYEEGLDVLLRRWDAERDIERNLVYKKLSVQRKKDLLSKIALITFETGDYLFKQRVVEEYITDYIRNLPGANTDDEALDTDSQAVLRSITAQHGLLVERAKGIYSFSHLTFHEYFTAREIVFRRQPLEEALQTLVGHIKDKRWREIFLLAVGILQPSADRLLLLMKQQVEALVAGSEELQTFLHWVYVKSNQVNVRYKLVAVRAFYLDHALELMISVDMAEPRSLELDLTVDLELTRALASTTLSPDLDLARDLAFGLDLKLDEVLARDLGLTLEHVSILDRVPSDRATAYKISGVLDRVSALSRVGILDDALKLELEPELKQDLQKLKAQLPDPDEDEKRINKWWQSNGQAWAEELRMTMIGYRLIGYDWRFSKEQERELKQYYNTNVLLVECLNSDGYVSREVRQEIEDTLLLPITEIEKYS